MTDKDEERRQKKRHRLVLTLEVFDAGAEKPLGMLTDITTEGLMLTSAEKIPLHREYFLEIRLEDRNAALFYDDGESKMVRFRANSLWQTQNDAGLYQTGFRMIDVSPTTLVSLSYLIRKFREERKQPSVYKSRPPK